MRERKSKACGVEALFTHSIKMPGIEKRTSPRGGTRAQARDPTNKDRGKPKISVQRQWGLAVRVASRLATLLAYVIILG